MRVEDGDCRVACRMRRGLLRGSWQICLPVTALWLCEGRASWDGRHVGWQASWDGRHVGWRPRGMAGMLVGRPRGMAGM